MMSQQSQYPVQFVISNNQHQIIPIKYLNACTIDELLIAAKSVLSKHEIKNNKIIIKHSDEDIYMESDSDVEDEFDSGNYTKTKPLRLIISLKQRMNKNHQPVAKNSNINKISQESNIVW